MEGTLFKGQIMNIRKTLAVCALFAIGVLRAGEEEQQYKVIINAHKNYSAIMSALNQKGSDILGVDFSKRIIDINAKASELKWLKEQNWPIEIQEQTITSIDDRYLDANEVADFLTQVHEQFPKITKLEVIGNSLEGRPILAIKISDHAEKHESHEPAILFNALHHAREVMTPEVATDIVDFLTSQYQKDAAVTKWVDQNEIWIIPMLNVDGSSLVWSGQPMWRKNTRGGFGVDINRNYPTNWAACEGSSARRYSQTYRGPEAASEPETRAMMNFVAKIKPVFNISYHSYSELVIYPYGCDGQRAQNINIVEGIGKKMGALLDYTPGTSWETLYSVDGSDIDWMYEQHQVIAYVIEVSPRSDGFGPSYDKRDATVLKNRKGWQFLLERLEGAGIHGIRPEKEWIALQEWRGGSYVPLQRYKINPDGSFHLILSPGRYQLSFESPGQDSIIEEVILENQPVNL